MFDRFHPALRVVCLALAAVVVSQIVRLALAKNPLESLSFTTLPALPAAPKTQVERKGATAAPAIPWAKDDADVPPAVRARVERITQSEVLGAVIKPLPMALLGIAGKDAFLGAPSPAGWRGERTRGRGRPCSWRLWPQCFCAGPGLGSSRRMPQRRRPSNQRKQNRTHLTPPNPPGPQNRGKRNHHPRPRGRRL